MSAVAAGGSDEWDVVVIGGGPPGENAAQYATESSGLSAVIIEEKLVGGECSYWACMPSKALLRPVELREEERLVPGLDGAGRRLGVDAVLAWRDRVVNGHDDRSQVQWAEGAGIAVVRGRGRLKGVRAVEVEDPAGGRRVIRARQAVVLDTGSRPLVPDVPGLAHALAWTSRDVTNLHDVPRRVAIIGGGTVACEAATWLLGFGAEIVHIIEQGDALLARSEPFARDLVLGALGRAGADVRLNTKVRSVRRDAPRATGEGRLHGGAVEIVLSGGERLTVDEIVVAAGRLPNSIDIGLDTVGLPAGGPIVVDDQLRVAGVDGDWLYAVGDVCGRAQLTHMGKYQARVAGDVIAARAAGRPLALGDASPHRDRADDGEVPQVAFTSPPVAWVGRTEEAARAHGIEVEVVEYDLGAVAGTSLQGPGAGGRAKLVLDAHARLIVGATFVGPGAPELLHSATVAIVGRVPLDLLWHAVPSYPTVSEVWLRLLETERRQRAERAKKRESDRHTA
jgi:dihydrolipoamide dehydrogenase